MKIEQFNPNPSTMPLSTCGGGLTSPYADPPHAPVFVINARIPTGAGHRITLTEEEAARTYVAMGEWLEDLARRRAVVES